MAKAQKESESKKPGGRSVTLADVPISSTEPIPDIFIDGFQGVLVRDGVAKLNLFTDIHDPRTGEIARRVTARLITPVVTLAGIHSAVGEVLEGLKRDGILVSDDSVPSEKDNK